MTDVFIVTVCCVTIFISGFIMGKMHERGKWLDRMKGWMVDPRDKCEYVCKWGDNV
jgi:hypothetical protein